MTMSGVVGTDSLPSTIAGELTTTLIPTVTRIDSRLDVGQISLVLAVSIVCILSPITVTGNSIILAALYRYKRLRTASNYLLVSLAISDFGVGVFMPFGMQLELSGLPENGTSILCIIPYCIVIALCSVSVLVTVAIAVDRLTSLAQPLRYKNIITHSSIEKYIAVFWIYAIAVGLSPLIYAQMAGLTQPHSGGCRFGAAVLPPVRVFLVMAVWAPSALVLLCCYMYVYLVARAHARAIYTVELSFRHQTQALVLPRYGQTLAVTVGAFFILWLPFQTCMLVDIFYDTNILSEWAVVWLGLPILAHSGVNPWIYAFHHGEMRIAAGKIAEDLIALIGVSPSRYGCSPARRVSNTYLELAEVNETNDDRRPQEDNCLSAKQHNPLYGNRCLEASMKCGDISPERNEADRRISSKYVQNDIVEEDIEDLTKMLDQKYITDRNHVIDSNHNVDKIKNLKHFLDPTLNKIRHLRRLNRKRLLSKNFAKFPESKFISYQNLKSDGTFNVILQSNAMSDPVLNADNPATSCTKDFSMTLEGSSDVQMTKRNSNLSSVSYPNIKTATGNVLDLSAKLLKNDKGKTEAHRFSAQKLDFDVQLNGASAKNDTTRSSKIKRKTSVYLRPRARFNTDYTPSNTDVSSRIYNSYLSLCTLDGTRRSLLYTPKRKISSRNIKITTNKLLTLIPSGSTSTTNNNTKYNIDFSLKSRIKAKLKHSESSNEMKPLALSTKYSDNSKLVDSLTVPIVHSEPPSPLEPLPLFALKEKNLKTCETLMSNSKVTAESTKSIPQSDDKKDSTKRSESMIPSVLLNIEDFSESKEDAQQNLWNDQANCPPTLGPMELFEALLRNSDRSRDCKCVEPLFTGYDSTKFSSRRPSNSKWSESSKSQEILSNVSEHQSFPSSYSVNNFRTCNSGSDLNDLTSLDPFMCPETLTSSLHESFFGAPSALNSDIFTSFEETDGIDVSPERETHLNLAPVYNSMSTMSLKSSTVSCNMQSKSTEFVYRVRHGSTKSCRILQAEPPVHHNRLRMRSCRNQIRRDTSFTKKGICLAPLATPTPTEICTPTCDLISEMKHEDGVLV